jgi:hypothetical protein
MEGMKIPGRKRSKSRSGSSEMTPMRQTLYIIGGAFIVLLLLFLFSDNCMECTKNESVVKVCRDDDGNLINYTRQLNFYRDRGYICK